jgi:CubicO group peptidase (beta-lactamase class C family)
MWWSGLDFRTATDRDVIQLVAGQSGLLFMPGRQFRYSRTGYYLLGVVLRRVLGAGVERWFAQQVFEPKRMRRTSYVNGTTCADTSMLGFEGCDNGFASLEVAPHAWDTECVYSTPSDLLQWNRCITTEGDEHGRRSRLLTCGTLDRGDEVPYGLGIGIWKEGGALLVHHTAAGQGLSHIYLWLPAFNSSILVLSNFRQGWSDHRAVRIMERLTGYDAAYAAIARRTRARAAVPPPPIEPTSGAAFEGVYHCPALGATYVVEASSDAIGIRWSGRTCPLVRMGESEFRAAEVTVRFTPEGMQLRSAGLGEIACAREAA